MCKTAPNEISRPRRSSGICSVTLRDASIEDVVAVAATSGLNGIEWGTDTHVHDDASAILAGEATRAAGLRVMSLGSYYRAGSFEDFGALTRRAILSGAPRIRVWAGSIPSAHADGTDWETVVEDTQRIAGLAAVSGLSVAFEFHSGTLTDSAPSTVRLLRRVDRNNVGTYWQPIVGHTDEQAITSLLEVADFLYGIHCFSWWPTLERHPLATREHLWRTVAETLRKRKLDVDLMLEFVQDDLARNVARDAACLNELLSGSS